MIDNTNHWNEIYLNLGNKKIWQLANKSFFKYFEKVKLHTKSSIKEITGKTNHYNEIPL